MDGMSERKAKLARNTAETQVEVEVCLDGTGKTDLRSSVPFLDHMLDQVARHGLLDLTVIARGDLQIDAHHTVEDVGIGARITVAIQLCVWAHYDASRKPITIAIRCSPKSFVHAVLLTQADVS